MQLSLIDQVPEFTKSYFLDVFAEASFSSGRMRLKTIQGQQVPEDLSISIPSKFISLYPEGTIYKLDTKLIQKDGRKPYFVALKGKGIQRAIEFFDYNLKVQKKNTH
ncbi:hypothetical protein [Leadbetterella byssophila]|jgi:hypothetical protein|uniref:Uncharacterized protein n=1 Tax=Leadbetterella byssophila (strain DSM 17132 / JCM 16389 / KACC 11308 / NBRC 106382 / 4M15) TaxID=649349 RepID=E4RSN5_LEAB4|nr:hypothetical protein [Leadbetterella byssophila]ADQ15885.1 hypothetical protein Lbys_0089 [Leadbetterella byssophila DSM 17132]